MEKSQSGADRGKQNPVVFLKFKIDLIEIVKDMKKLNRITNLK